MVDDVIANDALISLALQSHPAAEQTDVQETPLQALEASARITLQVQSRDISREQVKNFLNKFDEDTTWAELKQLGRKYAKELDEAYEQNIIVNDWKSNTNQGRGR